MRAQAFTDEEVEILRNNSYTAYVSNCSIRFTLEFKENVVMIYSREVTSQVDMLARTFGDCCGVFDFGRIRYGKNGWDWVSGLSTIDRR